MNVLITAQNRLRLLTQVMGVLLLFMVAMPLGATSSPFNIAYSGRLVSSTGKPLTGPLVINLEFYHAATGGTQKGPTYHFSSVNLDNGIFKLAIEIDPADFSTIFSETGGVWVQVTDVSHNNNVYPRLRFFAVPYAIRVPVDNTTIGFNGSGQLALLDDAGAQIVNVINASSSTVNASRLPTIAVAGDVTGNTGANKVEKIQGRSVADTTPNTDEYLRWNGSAWAPASLTSGLIGPQGLAGSQILTGSGAPAIGAGVLGDSYVDTSSGDLYTKTGAGWGAAVANLMGPTGATGAQGPAGSQGVQGPQGNQGAAGAAGSQITTAAGAPSDASGSNNDVYINSTTGDYYKKAAGTWGSIAGNLKGPTGATGAQGPQGPAGVIGANSPLSLTSGTLSIDLSGKADASALSTHTSDGTIHLTQATIDANTQLSGTSKVTGLDTALSGKEGAISTGTTAQYYRGGKTWATLDTDAVTEGGNKYFSQALARGAISALPPLSYSIGTGQISMSQAGSGADGYLSSTDWSAINAIAAQWTTFGGDIYRASGNVGIGSATPGKALDVNGSIRGTAFIPSGNLYIGSSASATGTSATAIGNSASANAQQGLALGNGANGSGVQSTALGTSANASSNYSIAIGYNAYSWAGIAIGVNANGSGLGSVTIGGTSAGSYSTAIGGGTSSAGTYSVALGNAAATTGTGGIALGVSSSSPANTFVAGSGSYPINTVYFGTGMSNASPSAYTISGTRGTGTDIVGGALQLAGGPSTGTGLGGVIAFQTSSASTVSGSTVNTLTERMRIDQNGNVGIGSTQPLGKLDVAGSICLNGASCISSWPAGTVASVSGTAPISVANGTTTPAISITQATTSANGYLSSTDWNTFNGKLGSLNGLTGSVQTLANAFTGTTPAWDSTGTTHTLNIPMASTASVTAGLVSNTDWTTFNGKQGALAVATSASNGYLASSDWLAFNSKQPLLSYTPLNKNGDTMSGALNLSSNGLAVGTNQLVVSNGNVGIGTTVPNNLLELSGGALSFYKPSEYVAVGLDYDATTDALRLRSNSGSDNLNQTNMTILRASGCIGIGTTSPQNNLSVSGGIEAVGTTPILFNAYTNGANWLYDQSGVAGKIEAVSASGGNMQLSMASSGTAGVGATLTSALGINSNGGIEVGSSYVGSFTPPSDGAIIQGNVGIGTTAPGAKLQIAGTAGADGIMFPDGTTQRSAGYVVRIKSSAYTVTASDQNALFLVSGATNLTLPSAVTVGANFLIKIKKTDANDTFVSATPTGGQTVDGTAGAYKFYTRNATATLISDGTGWQAIDVLGTTTSTIQTCGQTAETNCYDNKVALLAGYAMVNIGGTDYEIKTTTIGTSKIWVNLAGNRLLEVNGLAAWQVGLLSAGEATSRTVNGGTVLTSTDDIGGRACPLNVYIKLDDWAVAGRCLYYDKGNPSQLLDASPNLTGIQPVPIGTQPLWFQGNIDTCANKGMRLPTIFETSGTIRQTEGRLTPLTIIHSVVSFDPVVEPSSSAPAYGGQKGVPSCPGSYTWTATPMPNGYVFWVWQDSVAESSGFGDTSEYHSQTVRCVLP